jgi:predicted unusual protein kinase regulating ubiquinone biosynthesis (AarF/ABC1/UbiB family)
VRRAKRRDVDCQGDQPSTSISSHGQLAGPNAQRNDSETHTGPTSDTNDSRSADDEGEVEGITFLDAGLCTSLSEIDQRNFLDLFEAVALGRGEEAGRLLLKRSKHCEPGREYPASCVDPQGFVKGVQEIVSKVSMDSFRLSKVQIGVVLQRIMTLVRRHNVELVPNFTTLVISIVILEGVGRQLNPDLDIFQAALPVLLHANSPTKIRLLRTAMERGGRSRATSSSTGASTEASLAAEA